MNSKNYIGASFLNLNLGKNIFYSDSSLENSTFQLPNQETLSRKNSNERDKLKRNFNVSYNLILPAIKK